MRQSFVKMVLSVGVFVMLAGTPPAAQAASCLSGATGTQHRRCDFKRDDGATGSYCAQFYVTMGYPQKFYMLFPGGAQLRCTCEATGSFTTPKFDAGKDFLCGQNSAGLTEFADAASGKVLGQKIKNGRYHDGYDPVRSWVFECEPDPACP